MRSILDYIDKMQEMYGDKEPRNMYSEGQLVQNTVDGSRPGYNGNTSKVYNEKTGHIYPGGNAHSNWWSKNPGKNQHKKSLKNPEYIEILTERINDPKYKNYNYQDLVDENIITDKEYRELKKLGIDAQFEGKHSYVPKNKANIVRSDKIKKVQGSNISMIGQGQTGTQFSHVYPLIESAPPGTQTTFKIDAKMNRKLEGFNEIGQKIAEKQELLIKNKPEGYKKRLEILNGEAKLNVKNAIQKLGPEYKGQIGYFQVDTETGVFKNKAGNYKMSFSGIEGENKKYIEMSGEERKNFERAESKKQILKDLSTPKGKTSFKTHLQNSRNKTAAEAQAKLFKKLGINIDDVCSNLVAGGGRIGFATKKCGMALVQSNPDEFIKIAGGEKYKSIYQKLLKENPNKVKSAARGIVKNIRKLGIANPFSWIGGEVWYVGLDTWASSAKGIPFGEALDKAFIFKDFGTTHSNLIETAKEMGYSDLQLENLQQTLDLSANQQDIERREYNLPGFQKESENWEKLKGTDLYTNLSGAQGKMAFDQFKNAEKQLALANKKQDNLWTNYMSNISEQTGKDVSQITQEDINIGFTSTYNVAEDKVRKELIAQGKGDYEDKARYVHPYSSGFGEAFYNLWPGNWNIFNPTAGLLEYGSPEQVAEINKKRNYLTWEQLQDPNIPLPKEAMSGLYERSDDLGYLFEGASGGRAGYMGGGITGIRKPSAIPPERQGLRSILINGKKS